MSGVYTIFHESQYLRIGETCKLDTKIADGVDPFKKWWHCVVYFLCKTHKQKNHSFLVHAAGSTLDPARTAVNVVLVKKCHRVQKYHILHIQPRRDDSFTEMKALLEHTSLSTYTFQVYYHLDTTRWFRHDQVAPEIDGPNTKRWTLISYTITVALPGLTLARTGECTFQQVQCRHLHRHHQQHSRHLHHLRHRHGKNTWQ